MKKKLKLKRISNEGIFNIVEVSKKSLFLDKLQDFLVDMKLDKIWGEPYVYENKKYGLNTYSILFEENKDGKDKKRVISDFKEGEMHRYHNKDIELLILFLSKKIRIIFYCDSKNREKINKELSKFVNIK